MIMFCERREDSNRVAREADLRSGNGARRGRRARVGSLRYFASMSEAKYRAKLTESSRLRQNSES